MSASFSLALDYQAHDGCPPQAVFIEHVLARTTKARFESAGAGVSVRIVRASDKSRGELVLDGGDTRRSLDGATCADVVSGLAFALALAIDAREAPPDAPVVSAPTSIAPPIERDVPHAPASAKPTPSARRLAFGFASTLASLDALAWMIGPWTRFRHDAWTIRVAGLTATTSVERARFRRWLGSLEGCYGRTIAGCLGFEAGVVHANGVGVADAAAVDRAWFAPTVALRAEVRPIEAMVLEARIGLAVPLVRDTFVLLPSTTLHREPALSPFVGLGLAVSIP